MKVPQNIVTGIVGRWDLWLPSSTSSAGGVRDNGCGSNCVRPKLKLEGPACAPTDFQGPSYARALTSLAVLTSTLTASRQHHQHQHHQHHYSSFTFHHLIVISYLGHSDRLLGGPPLLFFLFLSFIGAWSEHCVSVFYSNFVGSFSLKCVLAYEQLSIMTPISRPCFCFVLQEVGKGLQDNNPLGSGKDMRWERALAFE